MYMLGCVFWWSGLTAFFLLHVFSFEKSRRCDNNQQITVSHFGEYKRLHLESSKQNYYIISCMSNNKSNFHPNELTKTMTDEKFQIVKMWVNEILTEDTSRQRETMNGTILQLHKGGGTNKLSDQRPVVWLNSVYQLPNYVINKRLKKLSNQPTS